MKGEVVYLYAFDVANEIVTGGIKEILGQKPLPLEVRKDRPFPRDVPVYRPLTVELLSSYRLNGQILRVLIRVYDVGVISIVARATFEKDSLRELTAFHSPRLETGQTLDEASRDQPAEGRTERNT